MDRSFRSTLKMTPTPYESCGFVKVADLTLTPNQARKYAEQIIEAADWADESMAQLRSGLLHKLN
jgi:hypothetical protein